jgi:hypothetical protein
MRVRVNKWCGVLAAGAGCAVLFCAAMPALAMPQFMERGRKLYSLGKENGKCQLCHDYDPAKKEEPNEENLNVFAKDIKKGEGMKMLHGLGEDDKLTAAQLAVLDAAFKAVEEKDSDGDGASNKEELVLGTYPGDAKSTPAKEALEKYRKDNPKK